MPEYSGLSIDIDQSHGEVHIGDTLRLNGKTWRVARIEDGPSHYGYRVAGRGLNRETLTSVMAGMSGTVRRAWLDEQTEVAAAAIWAALSSEERVIPIRVTVWLEEAE